MNDIKYTISAFNDSALVYGSTVLTTADVETVLALNDELFEDKTLYQVKAFVDGKEVYDAGKFNKIDLDIFLNAADEAVEKVIQ